MGAYLDHNPAAAFAALLGATVMWGPAGIIYGLPATFLQARAQACIIRRLWQPACELQLCCEVLRGPAVMLGPAGSP